MNANKPLFGIFTIVLGAVLAVFTSGCTKEYYGGGIDRQLGSFSNGAGWYQDPETEAVPVPFTLPPKAIFHEDYSPTGNGDKNYLGWDLFQLYWDVRFLSLENKHRASDNKDVVRVRFMAKNKRTPADIEKGQYVAEVLGVSYHRLTPEQINEQAKARLMEKYGEKEAAAFLKKFQSATLVLVDGAVRDEVTKKAKEITPPSSVSSWGTPQEKALVGTYQSVTPPYVLRLSYSGKVSMQNLESGDRNDGKWFIQDGSLVTTWDSNGSKTAYEINSDGSFKSSHGILFVKTQ